MILWVLVTTGAVDSVGNVPLSASARRAVSIDQDMLAQVLTGGDDYEILFTVPPDAVERIDALSRETDITLTRIGEMRLEPPEGAERVAGECLESASQSLARKYIGKAQRLLGQVMTQRGAYGRARRGGPPPPRCPS